MHIYIYTHTHTQTSTITFLQKNNKIMILEIMFNSN